MKCPHCGKVILLESDRKVVEILRKATSPLNKHQIETSIQSLSHRTISNVVKRLLDLSIIQVISSAPYVTYILTEVVPCDA